MKKTNLLLILLILFAAFFCTICVASAFGTRYVGNTVVDLAWSKYPYEDFSCYKINRSDQTIAIISDRNTTFYRDSGLSKGVTYDYKHVAYNKTGVIKWYATRSAATGNVHGTITKDLTWTAATSPYTLTGGVSVAADATLTIANGVTVNSGSHGISVSGTLSPLDTVTFNGEGIALSEVDDFSVMS